MRVSLDLPIGRRPLMPPNIWRVKHAEAAGTGQSRCRSRLGARRERRWPSRNKEGMFGGDRDVGDRMREITRMRALKKTELLAAAAFAALAIGAAPATTAQATTIATGLTEPGYQTPRTGWGVPDLQGFWSNTSFTGMQRPAGATKLILSEEEAAALARRNVYTGARREEAGASKV